MNPPARLRIALALLGLLVVTETSGAQPAAPVAPPPAPPAPVLRVVTSPVPPFIIENPDGSFAGISMDLWRELARRLDLRYEIEKLPVAALKQAVETASADVYVSLNISAEREAQLDLSHAFYSTGLAIAVAPHAESGLLTTLGRIFSGAFLSLVLTLLAVLLVFGLLMWLIERRRNPGQFGGAPSRGIAAGLWWSAVTMTTVGYGDKAPVTVLGRVLAIIWMFAAIIVISSFTAQVSSTLTVQRLASRVNGPDDLPAARVGTVDLSAGQKYCARRGIGARAYADAPAALDGLARGEVDAIVYEAPILAYWVKTQHAGALRVLPGTFDNHGYGFGLKPGSPLREPIDRALLTFVASDEWDQLLARYLGP